MSIVVIGATGKLGRLVVEDLLAKKVPAGDVVAAGRNRTALEELGALGVRTATVDFGRPDTIGAAVSAGDTLLLISGSEVGRRIDQHRNVIEAAKAAGVARIVYTSAPQATTSALILAPEHKATEELIVASGLPYTILRNGWYNENYVATVDQARQTGVVLASAGDGKVSSANRSDYAEAAAVVLTQDGHEGKVYELSGDTAWDQGHLASVIGEIIDSPVTYRSVTPEEQAAILKEAGLDEGTIGFVVGLDGNIRDGLLGETSGELAALIGHPTVPLAEGLRAAV
ncbi:SDR family oxidoreductase [Nakamurella silvestris]|nr:SDR family oxidoreductase [Nakamurella silvestris]